MNVAAILGVFNDFSNQTGTGRTKQGKIRAKVIKSFELKCTPVVFTNKLNVC